MTKDDVEDVLPAFAKVLADPVHLVPVPGRLHHYPEEDDAAPKLASTPPHGVSWQPQQLLLKDRVSELKALAAVEVRGQTHTMPCTSMVWLVVLWDWPRMSAHVPPQRSETCAGSYDATGRIFDCCS